MPLAVLRRWPQLTKCWRSVPTCRWKESLIGEAVDAAFMARLIVHVIDLVFCPLFCAASRGLVMPGQVLI